MGLNYHYASYLFLSVTVLLHIENIMKYNYNFKYASLFSQRSIYYENEHTWWVVQLVTGRPTQPLRYNPVVLVTQSPINTIHWIIRTK